MAQTGYSPIKLYGSTTASAVPLAANLTTTAFGVELAVNAADGKLFYKDSGGVVQVLATKGSAIIGGATTQVQYNNAGTLAGSANMTFDGTSLTLASNPILSGGTANGVGYLNGSKVLTSGSALTFDGSNLGLGVTPSAWGSNYKAIESAGISTYAIAGANVNGVSIVSNAYATNAGGYLYKTTGAAAYYSVNLSQHLWFTAPSGTAGNAISFTQAMVLDASGNLSVGTTASLGRATIAGTFSVLDSGSAGYQTQISTTNGLSTINAYQAGNQSLAFNTTSAGSSTERARIDSSGNFGLGVTPSAWSGVTAFEGVRGSSLSFNQTSDQIFLTSGAYYNAGWKYATGRVPAQYGVMNGSHQWFNAPSGTAGNAITFTQAMTLDVSGNLGVGATPSAWNTAYRALQLTSGSVYASTGSPTFVSVTANAYYGASGYTRVATGLASEYTQSGGTHVWRTAGNAAAGSAITYSDYMTLSATGTFYLNTTTGSAKANIKVSSGQTYALYLDSDVSTNVDILANPNSGTWTVAPPARISFSGSGGFALGTQIEFWTKNLGTSGSGEGLRFTIAANGDVYPAQGATGMTSGFVFIPADTGAPTGTPTSRAGVVPMYFDKTNFKLYIYTPGTGWKSVTLT